MNNLTVFNNEIIPVYTTDTGEKVVIGRELHEKLKIDTPYTQWFERMCGYGFMENEDYSGFSQKSDKPQGGRPTIEHILTLDMAKHIAMIQRTPQGKEIRDKLISLETRVPGTLPGAPPPHQFGDAPEGTGQSHCRGQSTRGRYQRCCCPEPTVMARGGSQADRQDRPVDGRE